MTEATAQACEHHSGTAQRDRASSFHCAHHDGAPTYHNQDPIWFVCGCDGTKHMACQPVDPSPETPRPDDWPICLAWRGALHCTMSVPSGTTYGGVAEMIECGNEAEPGKAFCKPCMARDAERYRDKYGFDNPDHRTGCNAAYADWCDCFEGYERSGGSVPAASEVTP